MPCTKRNIPQHKFQCIAALRVNASCWAKEGVFLWVWLAAWWIPQSTSSYKVLDRRRRRRSIDDTRANALASARLPDVNFYIYYFINSVSLLILNDSHHTIIYFLNIQWDTFISPLIYFLFNKAYWNLPYRRTRRPLHFAGVRWTMRFTLIYISLFCVISCPTKKGGVISLICAKYVTPEIGSWFALKRDDTHKVECKVCCVTLHVGQTRIPLAHFKLWGNSCMTTPLTYIRVTTGGDRMNDMAMWW